MSASLKASADGTQAIIQVGGVDKVVVGPDTLQVHPNGGLGYGTGSGGTVTSTGTSPKYATINKPVGSVTRNYGTPIASGVSEYIIVTNSILGTNDLVVVNLYGPSTTDPGRYVITVREANNANTFIIRIQNVSGLPYDEPLVLKFAIIKGAAA